MKNVEPRAVFINHCRLTMKALSISTPWYIVAATYFMPRLQYAFILSFHFHIPTYDSDTLSKLIFAIWIFAPGSSFTFNICFAVPSTSALFNNQLQWEKVQYLRSIYCEAHAHMYVCSLWRLPWKFIKDFWYCKTLFWSEVESVICNKFFRRIQGFTMEALKCKIYAILWSFGKCLPGKISEKISSTLVN